MGYGRHAHVRALAAGDENAQAQTEISGQAAAVRIGGKLYLSETVNSVQELAGESEISG